MTYEATIGPVIAYLIGSLPFGYFVARIVAGTDIRQLGSGNIGATNVARSLGAKWGILVLFLDALKGLLPTLLIPQSLFPSEGSHFTHFEVGVGLMTIIGHMFPVWLRFRGGKGVATALGVAVVLSWMGTAAAFVVFAMIFSWKRIVSLGSVLAALTFAITVLSTVSQPFGEENWPLSAFALAAPTLIIARHRTNIVRLIRGEEGALKTASQSVVQEEEPTDQQEHSDQPSSE